ncbi:MAG: type II toxin-antitoxin system VapC family toxin [Bacteroidetes bacterium]|nr:type II toxin-antitoxin system VapC family toxin [Bacteroidota bacterium]
MNLLLDTQAFIYFVNGDSKLSTKAKAAILDSTNIKFVSIVSVWEISIKVSLNKLDLTAPLHTLPSLIENNGFGLQDIELADTLKIATFPFHHRDPFDRLLCAQALNNNFIVITSDVNFPPYGVQTLW